MKRRWIYFALVFLLSVTRINAQKASFDEKEFFSHLRDSYYTLSASGSRNFVALVTSLKMETLADEMWKNKEVFPLQLIWFNPNKIYISQKGVPKIPQGKYKEYQEVVNGLKMQLKGILLDLQRFYLQGLYNSIAGDYILQHNKEAVQITQVQKSGDMEIKSKYLFGLNGLCLFNEIVYPKEQKVITIEPHFKTVKSKWLCTGWKVQTVVNGEINSGFNLVINNVFINNVWVPAKIDIEVQKADAKGKTFFDQIKLKNYLFNQSIQLMSQPNANQ